MSILRLRITGILRRRYDPLQAETIFQQLPRGRRQAAQPAPVPVLIFLDGSLQAARAGHWENVVYGSLTGHEMDISAPWIPSGIYGNRLFSELRIIQFRKIEN